MASYITLNVAENSPIPVRLSPELIARLDDAAKKIGNTRAGIIRFCTDTFLTHFEKHGRAALPPDWEDILSAFDNRTKESRLERFPEIKSGAVALNEKPEVLEHRKGAKRPHSEQDYESHKDVIVKRDKKLEEKVRTSLSQTVSKLPKTK